MTLCLKSFILRIEQFGLANFKLRWVSFMNVPIHDWFSGCNKLLFFIFERFKVNNIDNI